MEVYLGVCHRQRGGSVRDCGCRIPDEGGWLECPPGVIAGFAKAEYASEYADPMQAITHNGYSLADIPAGNHTLGASKRDAARSGGFTGDLCDTCGGVHMVRSGTCLLCRDCGSTAGGCS